MNFSLEIKATTGNGFSETHGEVATEVARILREAADKLERGVTDFSLYSEVGTKVGSAELRQASKPARKPGR